jgi:hypothetical protein
MSWIDTYKRKLNIDQELIFGLITDNPSDCILNGWKDDAEWLDSYFKNTTIFNNKNVTNVINSHQEYKDYCNNQLKLGDNLPFVKYGNPNLYNALHLNKIPEDKKYIYPIKILGRLHIDEHLKGCDTIFIPEKVVHDARNNKCKILFHEYWEGHGFNLESYRLFFKNILEKFNLPEDCLGFVDGNSLTPMFQERCGLKGFTIFFFEAHIFRSLPGQNTSIGQIRVHNTKIIRQTKTLPYRFINLNRRYKKHRTRLTHQLFLKHNDKTLWSYTDPTNDNQNHLSLIEEKYKSLFLSQLPKIIDVDGTVNDIQVNYNLQAQAYINIISETFFYEPSTQFITEKTFKAIASGQPFILVGSQGILGILKKLGYKTFDGLINESYDSIEDNNERMKAIFKEIDRLSNMPDEEFKDLMSKCYTIGLENMKTFLFRTTTEKDQNRIKRELLDWLEN